MKNILLITLSIGLFILSASTTVPGDINKTTGRFSDTVLIAKGEVTFNKFCTGCHNFRQDGIGPQLGGLFPGATAEWIKHFIKNPQAVIKAGDKRAVQLVQKYKTVMPAFPTLTGTELNGLVAFLSTQKKPNFKADNGNELANPVKEAIKMSDLVVKMQLVTKFPVSSDSGKMPLTRINKLDFQPGTNVSFVADQRGKLYRMTGSNAAVFMDLAVLKPAFMEHPGLASGFGSFAFHPDFKTNGLLYTTHCEPGGTARADFQFPDSIKVTLQWVITEWKMEDLASAQFKGTGREVLRVNMVAANHGMQEVIFNPYAKKGDEDYGLLYIGIGDGGSVENGFAFLAHDRKKVWGTILRIDPLGSNSPNGRYGIPASNPFVGSNDGSLGEIYAYGFRNPHRITWTKSNQLLASNVGHGNIESINLIEKGKDYGWPIREGSFMLNPFGNMNKVFALPANDSSFGITYPVAQYDHDEGNAISGGYEYTGNAIPQLKGKFLFGDIPLGRLFYIDLADIGKGKMAPVKEWQVSVGGSPKTLTSLCGSRRVDLHFGRDASGEIYVLTKADGKMYKLTGVQ